jgi:hypothetical protein
MKATSTKIMNRQLLLFAFWFVTATSFGQGLVNFSNTSTQAVTVGLLGHEQLMSGAPGSYYFGLLTDPTGSGVLSFAGVYATNGTVPGLFSGGNSVAVAGWQPGLVRGVEIAGWSADLGHDWNPAWLMGSFPLGAQNAVFGISSEGVAAAGAASPVWPAGNLFFSDTGNEMGIVTGFNLFPVVVPEPTSLQFWCLIGAVLSIWRFEPSAATNPAMTTRCHAESQLRRFVDRNR